MSNNTSETTSGGKFWAYFGLGFAAICMIPFFFNGSPAEGIGGLAFIALLYLVVWKVMLQPAAKHKKLMATGIEAEATIKSIRETGSSYQRGGALPKAGVELQIEVNAKDMPAYGAVVKTFLSVFEIQNFQPGSKITVKYDATDPQKLAVVEGHAFSDFQNGQEASPKGQKVSFFRTGQKMSKEEVRKLIDEMSKLQQDLFIRGIEEKAVILSSRETGITAGSKSLVLEMDIEVAPGTSASMVTKLYAVIMKQSVYKAVQGKGIKVKTDPADRTRLTMFGFIEG